MGETCRKLLLETVSNVEDLGCSQEEADTRMFLHEKHYARSGITAVVIVSDDTDVSSQLPNSLFIKSRTKTRTEYVGVKKADEVLGQNNCTGLLGLHAFTECDTVSCFSGKGKVSALRLLTSDRHKDTLKCQSSNWEVSPQFLKSLESLTCSLYTYCAKNEIENINELRFNIFSTRKFQAATTLCFFH